MPKDQEPLHLDADEQIVIALVNLQKAFQILLMTGSPTEAVPAFEDSLFAIQPLSAMVTTKLAKHARVTDVHEDTKAKILDFKKKLKMDK